MNQVSTSRYGLVHFKMRSLQTVLPDFSQASFVETLKYYVSDE